MATKTATAVVRLDSHPAFKAAEPESATPVPANPPKVDENVRPATHVEWKSKSQESSSGAVKSAGGWKASRR